MLVMCCLILITIIINLVATMQSTSSITGVLVSNGILIATQWIMGIIALTAV